MKRIPSRTDLANPYPRRRICSTSSGRIILFHRTHIPIAIRKLDIDTRAECDRDEQRLRLSLARLHEKKRLAQKKGDGSEQEEILRGGAGATLVRPDGKHEERR